MYVNILQFFSPMPWDKTVLLISIPVCKFYVSLAISVCTLILSYLNNKASLIVPVTVE